MLAAARDAAATPDHRPRGLLASFVGSLVPAGLLRNGGHGSIEESEIFNLRRDFLCSALISGGVILAAGRGATGTADPSIFDNLAACVASPTLWPWITGQKGERRAG